jgi:hypothetical protein
MKSIEDDGSGAIAQSEGLRERTGGEGEGGEAVAELWYVYSLFILPRSLSVLVMFTFFSLLSQASVWSRDLCGL